MPKTEHGHGKLVLPWAANPAHPYVAIYGKAAKLKQCGCILDKNAIDPLSGIIANHVTPTNVVEYLDKAVSTGFAPTNGEIEIFKNGLFLNPRGRSNLFYAHHMDSWFVAPSKEVLQKLHIPDDKVHRLRSGKTLYLEAGEKNPREKPKLQFNTVLSLKDTELQLLGSHFASIALASGIEAVVGISERGQHMAAGLRFITDISNREIFDRETETSPLTIQKVTWSVRRERDAAMSLQFLSGQKIGIVDDGIKTGTTLIEALTLLREHTKEAPPAEIHVFICVRQKDFIRHMELRKKFRKSHLPSIAKQFNVNSIHFLDEIFTAH